MKKQMSLTTLLAVCIMAVLVLPAQAQPVKKVSNTFANWTVGVSGGAFYSGKIAAGQVGDSSVYSLLIQDTTANFAFVSSTGTNPAYALFLNTGGSAYLGVEGSSGNRIVDNGASPYALAFQAPYNHPIQFATGVSVSSTRLTIAPNGNVGIGLASPWTPAAMLDVNGNVNVSGNIAAKYQDVAEWVPSSGLLVPGTVVTLDREKNNRVIPSTFAYDTAVAGVVSAKPGLILGEKGVDKSIVATTGRVKVHVDATKNAISVGDLLVTSDKPGLAMRSIPLDLAGTKIHRPGTIIGKALEPLPTGEGDILVLLSLQ